jgi:hypothetical protein
LWDSTIGCVISVLPPCILGDLLYKDKHDLDPQQQAITAFPEVRTVSITIFCHHNVILSSWVTSDGKLHLILGTDNSR